MVRLALSCGAPPCRAGRELRAPRGAQRLDARRRIIAAHHAAILEAWHEHCG